MSNCDKCCPICGHIFIDIEYNEEITILECENCSNLINKNELVDCCE